MPGIDANPCDPCLCGCLHWKCLCRKTDGLKRFRPGSNQSLPRVWTLSVMFWLACQQEVVWLGWELSHRTSGWGLQPDQDTLEPGDESWTQEKREGAQHLLWLCSLLGLPVWLRW